MKAPSIAVSSQKNSATRGKCSPRVLIELLNDSDPQKPQQTMKAMLQMKKIDLLELQDAFTG